MARFKEGDEFPGAKFFNALNDLLRRHGIAQGEFARNQFSELDHGTILVRNDTGETRDRFDILVIGESEIDPAESEDQFKYKTFFAGGEPSLTDVGKWAVLQTPLAAGAIGPARINGWTTVNLRVGEEWHRYAEITDDNEDEEPCRLISSDFGSARIVWKEEGTGDKWAVIDIGKTHYRRMFELKAPLGAGGEALSYLRRWVDDTEDPDAWEATEKEFVVSDPHGIFVGSGEDETYYGERGEAVWNPLSERWEIVQMQCGDRFEKPVE